MTPEQNELTNIDAQAYQKSVPSVFLGIRVLSVQLLLMCVVYTGKGLFSRIINFRQEADLGLGPFALTAVRTSAIDYTRSILIDYARVVGGRGRPEVDPWGFLLPFSLELWASILFSLVMVMAVVHMMALSLVPHLRETSGFQSAIFSYIRIILQQGQCLLCVHLIYPS